MLIFWAQTRGISYEEKETPDGKEYSLYLNGEFVPTARLRVRSRADALRNICTILRFMLASVL